MAPTPAEVQLAQRLRTLRTEATATQAAVAAALFAGQQVASGTVSTWENDRNPAPLPEHRLEPYARLFASSRSWTDKPHLVPEAELTSEEKARRNELLDELRELWLATRTGATQQQAASSHRSWFFYDDGPLTIICPDAPKDAMGPLVAPSNPNHTELHAYADLDALMELWGHIRAENSTTFAIRYTRASQFDADDLSGHVVLLGGIAWNDLSRQLERRLQRLPVRQVELAGLTTGDVFEVTENGKKRGFEPVWEDPKKPGRTDRGRRLSRPDRQPLQLRTHTDDL